MYQFEISYQSSNSDQIHEKKYLACQLKTTMCNYWMCNYPQTQHEIIIFFLLHLKLHMATFCRSM